MADASQIEALFGDDLLLPPNPAAKAVNRTPKTLAQWRSQGRGPKWVKIEGRIGYRLGDLRAFIAKGEG